MKRHSLFKGMGQKAEPAFVIDPVNNLLGTQSCPARHFREAICQIVMISKADFEGHQNKDAVINPLILKMKRLRHVGVIIQNNKIKMPLLGCAGDLGHRCRAVRIPGMDMEVPHVFKRVIWSMRVHLMICASPDAEFPIGPLLIPLQGPDPLLHGLK